MSAAHNGCLQLEPDVGIRAIVLLQGEPVSSGTQGITERENEPLEMHRRHVSNVTSRNSSERLAAMIWLDFTCVCVVHAFLRFCYSLYFIIKY